MAAPEDETGEADTDFSSLPRRSTRVRKEVSTKSTPDNASASKKKKVVKGAVKKTPGSAAAEKDSQDENGDNDARKQAEPKTKTAPQSKNTLAKATEHGEDEDSGNMTPKATPRKRKSSAKNDKDTDGKDEESPQKKKKACAHQVLTERDVIPKLWDPAKADNSKTLKIASWNVAGLRAVIKNNPHVISELVQKYDLDILCLQETKLQEQHVNDPKQGIPKLEEEGYQAYFSCSAEKKGYSGTAVFVRNTLFDGNKKPAAAGTQKKHQTTMDQFLGSKKAASKTKISAESAGSFMSGLLVLQNVSFGMGIQKHDSEGRMIVLDFSLFTMCNVYVPNSGQTLERLDYRTQEWDKDFLQFMQQKQADRGLPVFWVGDLNVAHTHLEVWNDGAKHLPKQAGVTPQERASFQAQLDAGFVDAFRRLHPTAAGHYSYWSTRAGNRPPNKGLRLDYFVCDPALFENDPDQSCKPVIVRDSYMLYEQMGSDHCPIVLELQVKGSFH